MSDAADAGRSDADVGFGLGAVLVVVLCALAPVWTSTSTGRTTAIPTECRPTCSTALVEECQGVVPLAADQTVLPNWIDADGEGDGEGRVWLELYQVDPEDGMLSPADPTAEQAAPLAAANSCLGAYEMEEWREPPQFDAFHRNMYYDYVAGALVPCLVARGIDARVPVAGSLQAARPGRLVPGSARGARLPRGAETWRDCPPVPEYLEDAGHLPDPVEVLS